MYKYVVLEVEVVCQRCGMEIPAGTKVYYDGKNHRHIQCGNILKDSYEARNAPRRKAVWSKTYYNSANI